MSTDPLARQTMPSPLGPLLLVAGPLGLRAVLWPGEDGSRVHLDASPGHHGNEVRQERHFDPRLSAEAGSAGPAAPASPADRHLDQVQRQLGEYFSGTRRSFDVVLDPVGTPFQLRAWAALRTIPFGQMMSYGQQARALGDPAKARAVGAANGRNPISIIVPCHRVVASSGSLTGFAGGLDAKAWLLEHERRVLAGR